MLLLAPSGCGGFVALCPFRLWLPLHPSLVVVMIALASLLCGGGVIALAPVGGGSGCLSSLCSVDVSLPP